MASVESIRIEIEQKLVDDNVRLHAALLKAKETIKALHGPAAWDIYDRNAPEMKIINEALHAHN